MESTVHFSPGVVERRVERVLLAKVGTFVLSGAIFLPASLSSAATPAVSTDVIVASASVNEYAIAAEPAELARMTFAAIDAIEIRSPAPAPRVTPALIPPPEPLVTNGLVLASWYGPGFYGNRTACGQTYTPEILGVAHRTLPCGTKVQITSPAGVTLVVSVIDRGPYVAGRSLDLSFAAKVALACSDLCGVRITVLN